MKSYDSLKQIFSKIHDLQQINAIMSWDESVIMPIGSGRNRRKIMSTLSCTQHDMLVSKKTEDLIFSVDENTLENPWDQTNFKLMKKQFIKSSCLPIKLVEEITDKTLRCTQVWRELREKNDWVSFAPYLSDVLELVKESASIKSEILKIAPYNVLLDDYAPGITQEYIEPLFSKLQQKIMPIVDEIKGKQSLPTSNINMLFPKSKQEKLCNFVMQAIGFDFKCGRLDTSHHPFCGGAVEDIRVTTRYDEENFLTALMGVCHETGHAMYENNLPKEWNTQPVGKAAGMSIHESQSLLIEMFFCRSEEFIEFMVNNISGFYPKANSLSIQDIYNAYTYVNQGYIRVNADEVTYPLHIILRYQIEKQLIQGELSIKDLPEIWDHYMTTFLGISTNGNFKDGVMQDIHWTLGAFGYFPSYTIGALFAAQQYQEISSNDSPIKEELKKGNFKLVFAWVKNNIHNYASLYDTTQLIKKSTGRSLIIEPFMQHISERYL